MEIQNIFNKKIKRKNFFTALASAAAGYILMRSIPYNLLGKRLVKHNPGSDRIKIKINSLAVGRKKISAEKTNTGDRNV
jgi:hypothetical protein